jgi:hypothetical protein
MANSDRLLVAIDACVLIEAVRLVDRPTGPRGTLHPSVRLMTAAAVRAFDLLLPYPAEVEAVRALRLIGEAEQLEALLRRCEVRRCPGPTAEQLASLGRTLLARVRHLNDVALAVAVAVSSDRPAYFISSNRSHWRGGPELQELLGDVVVVSPQRFLQLLGQ